MKPLHPARYWTQADGKIRCDLCPHVCQIAEGRTGRCGVRAVRNGALVAAGYGQVSSAHLDPIEKKPLYHFMPGRPIFSVGGWGCNFACSFCQNWTISQERRLDGERVAPEAVVEAAGRNGSVGIAYTYNEPLINIEYVMDCARLVRAAGLANVLVTNGYVNPGPAAELLPLVDAINLDIKSLDDSFYREQCRGTLRPVLDFAVQSVRAGCHVEITNLLIPKLNDDDDQVRRLARWVASHLGKATPLHLSAYHPDYKLDLPSTPAATLARAFSVASAELTYVYLGNARTDQGRDTLCPGCGAVLVQRRGFEARAVGLSSAGACAACGRAGAFRLELHRP
jgi:pyruvate formate lyase activating enzyme